MCVDADVAVCSSSGWAHGARVTGRKIVYCHTPARWLYQSDRYLRGRGVGTRAAASMLRARLVRWDKRAAASAHRYIANSSVVAERVREIYGLEAEVLPPPPTLVPGGAVHPVTGIDPGFVLCVSRLLPYKNVDTLARAFSLLPNERLVVVGTGPDEAALRSRAPVNVRFLGRVEDEQLRWLYGNSDMVAAASHEDFGLTPLEGASFGKPCVALRWGGFVDTVREGQTGIFFDAPDAAAIATAIRSARLSRWDVETVRRHAEQFAEARFIERIRAIVADVCTNAT